MNKIVESLMTARTQNDISEVVRKNLAEMNLNPNLFLMVRDSRKRVARIQKERLKSWSLATKN